MKALGIIINPRAGGVARSPALVERVRSWVPADRVRITRTPAEIGPALRALRDTGVKTLAIVGGDGSVSGTLTPLLKLWPQNELPAIVLTRGGTVNTISSSLGVRGKPEATIERLCQNRGHMRERKRPLVRVLPRGGAPCYGMIFANGTGPRFLEHYYEKSPRGPVGALYSIVASLSSAAIGGPLGNRVFSAFEAELEIDGQPKPLAPYTMMVAGSVTHIGLGFRIFVSAGWHLDRFHFSATPMGALGIGLRLPLLRLGLAPLFSTILQASSRRVQIRAKEPVPYTVDAELFPGVNELTLEAGPTLRFLVPVS